MINLPEGYYLDDKFCTNCKKETEHVMTKGIPGQSFSHDSFTCTECGWWGLDNNEPRSPIGEYDVQH